ncbi:alpha/beta hydrolase family protein [Barrientosiimonas humi]|uniref:alpha/beta hydrolase family protein n=1 Tax=Barrientosiimonas humi TaxID=999931 RepID=UPI00370D94D7
MTQPSSYGSWPSPVTADYVHGSTVGRGQPWADGEHVYWRETRPQDEGRSALVRRAPDGSTTDVSLPGQDVRTTLHEYGGGDYAVRDGIVVYVVRDGQRVWVSRDGGEPRPVTAETDGLVRYSGFCIDPRRGVAYAIREDQRDPSLEPVTSLVRLDLSGDGTGVGEVLQPGRERPSGDDQAGRVARGTSAYRDQAEPGQDGRVARGTSAYRDHAEPGQDGRVARGTSAYRDHAEPDDAPAPPDFVLDPALSPDGRRLAWLTWNHPQMAWDGTFLWVAELDDAGDLREARVVAGSTEESLEEPTWLDENRLLVLSDRGGWSTFHLLDLREESAGLRPVHDDQHDYGMPRWVPHMRSFALLDDGRVLAGRIVEGFRGAVLLDPSSGDVNDVELPITYIDQIGAAPGSKAVAVVGAADAMPTVVRIDPDEATLTPLAGETDELLERFAAPPEAITWSGFDGQTAHGFLYLPRNPDVVAPEGQRPPLLVTTHGGPTAATAAVATRARTYWTSRGFAVLDVNYAGSTGFGRAYRERLRGQWGVADVQDAALGAQHLADSGVVDAERMAIRGGSAGGYLTLAALTTTDVFSAGTSLFGIADVGALAEHTHKLESRYTWGLIGPWPDDRSTYDERSPINHLDGLSAPLLLLQGDEDKVVPPSQAQMMADALQRKGIAHALVLFAGEGHGFRVPANQIRAQELELSFYGQVFGFDPAGQVQQVTLS